MHDHDDVRGVAAAICAHQVLHSFRKRKFAGPLHEDDDPSRRDITARSGLPGYAAVQLGLLWHFRRVLREGPVRAMHRPARTRGVRLAVDQGRVLRNLPGRRRRHRKRRGALQGSPSRQETAASQSESHLRIYAFDDRYIEEVFPFVIFISFLYTQLSNE